TTAVGSYRPNAFGLYDMHGNVWEWCSDRYDNKYYDNGDMVDPKGPSGGKRHIIRGGSWKDDPALLRSADRKARMSGADRKNLGFRVVLELPESNTTKLSFKGQLLIGGDVVVQENPVPQLEKAEPVNDSQKTFVPVEHELIYNEKTQKGYISIKGMGLEARSWMVTKIGEICSSKNIVIQQGEKPESACFKLLDEKLKDGKFTIEFECK
ncbi:MAG: SUMF1/EgtB/PvdO family nonheme iron enzyme, partial [Phycisphaerae bacterium]|nr:SUMF1/EgtB/PvdO family nonheme iron enzyme [Phycisphaerae bacterium]